MTVYLVYWDNGREGGQDKRFLSREKAEVYKATKPNQNVWFITEETVIE